MLMVHMRINQNIHHHKLIRSTLGLFESPDAPLYSRYTWGLIKHTPS
jgi:hypothetical protein